MHASPSTHLRGIYRCSIRHAREDGASITIRIHLYQYLFVTRHSSAEQNTSCASYYSPQNLPYQGGSSIRALSLTPFRSDSAIPQMQGHEAEIRSVARAITQRGNVV